MRRKAILLLLMTASPVFAQAPTGVPRSFALTRAGALSDTRYHLHFTLMPRATTARGHEDLAFRLASPAPLWLDFREGSVSSVTINGLHSGTAIDNGHILLPADKLRAGENQIAIDFDAAVAPAGKGIFRYEDRDDHTEYLYTLFVPMDASMAFPCFDQPDVKGRFRLELTAPDDWTVISNTAATTTRPVADGQRTTVFAETPPLSTYLVAFAAGPFRRLETPGVPTLYVRQSKLQRAQVEAVEVQEITAQGMKYLADFFAQPFPFAKYEIVLIPGLTFGGMEHAGATFLREESVLFREAPTHTNLLRRDLLALHELTHQWFGDLTTMRWFDDLWLKEGFAEYMAFQALASLKPDEQIWKYFYESTKPDAYAIDSTKGTTPIYQQIPNLADAKSAYGAIVYSKAPGVLKQLAFVLGDRNFRDALRLYLKEHAYGNAEWSDLVRALERVSHRSLARWADLWIRRRGMPQIDIRWACDARQRVSEFIVSQHDVLNEGGIWPLAMQVLLAVPGGEPIRIRVDLDAPEAAVPDAIGRPCPAYVFCNDQDYAYGRFLPDPRSEAFVTAHVGRIAGLFDRTLLWGSLWDSVRQARLAPSSFVSVALASLSAEADESLSESLLSNVTSALHRYVDTETRMRFVPSMERLAAARMKESPQRGLRIVWFRALRGVAETEEGQKTLKRLLSAELTVPGVELRGLDRWRIVTALIALGDRDSETIFADERKRDSTGDGLKYAYAAEAARPDPATKRKYFEDYLHDPSRPEDWIVDSLQPFNSWNQSALTGRYLRPALDALPQIKRERKVFFLEYWLEAFIRGQQSAAADREVYDFLHGAKPEKDVELKILQVVDELDRTVRIRQKHGEKLKGRSVPS